MGCLEVSSQSVAASIQVKGFRRSSCKKFQAGDSVVTEMAAVHLFYTMSNVTSTVTAQQYASLLQQSIIVVLQARGCDTTSVFMKDGVTPHIICCVKQLLRLHFDDGRIISQKFPTAWPSKSLRFESL